ncbi:MAG: Peroxyureidoacrylate/ureidoacrylate amidohydrolase RutB [Pseudomonadota bacterium]|jgi:nicotinamidase-related amidase
MNPETELVSLGACAPQAWQVGAALCDMSRPPRAPRRVEVAALPQRVALDLNKTAMIVIDMQNDFCHPQGWLSSIGVDVNAARAPIAPLAQLLPALRAASVPILWVNWGNRPDKLNLSPCLLHVYNGNGRATGLGDALAQAPSARNRVLEKDSWGAAVVDELAIERGDIRIDKFRMSGFWDTPLDAILRNLGVSTVLFGGVNADQCVLATLMDANFLGYDTLLVQDCSATTSPAFCWDATLYNVRQCFGFTLASTDLLAQLA